jgi:hypothetical protein
MRFLHVPGTCGALGECCGVGFYNHQYVYGPYSMSESVQQSLAGRVSWWTEVTFGYRFVVPHIVSPNVVRL